VEEEEEEEEGGVREVRWIRRRLAVLAVLQVVIMEAGQEEPVPAVVARRRARRSC
jgi:hypothetical protein